MLLTEAYPAELRLYKSGAFMEWHQDDLVILSRLSHSLSLARARTLARPIKPDWPPPGKCGQQLFSPPQLEAVYTITNQGDSVTQWRDTRGDIHEAWTGAVGSSAYFLVLTFCICIISTRALC